MRRRLRPAESLLPKCRQLELDRFSSLLELAAQQTGASRFQVV